MFKRNLHWLSLSVLIIILDQAAKMMVAQSLLVDENIRMTSFLSLVHVHNYGAAFSFMDIDGGIQRWIFSLISLSVSIILIIWLFKTGPAEKRRPCALSLLIGGALSNFYDRFFMGSVLDFIDFHIGHYHWPAFNIADSAICIGAVLLIINLPARKQ